MGVESERLGWRPREAMLIATAEVSEDTAVARDKRNRNFSASDLPQVASKNHHR